MLTLVRLQHTSKEKLTEIFSNTDFCNKVASLKTKLSISPATECANRFTCLLQDALQIQNKKKVKNKNTFPRNTWFDEECKERKKSFKRAARKVKENPNDSALRELMWKERRIYKSLIKKKKHLAISKLHTELMEFKIKNPREFWRKISEVTKEEGSAEIPITPEELKAYLMTLLDCPKDNENPNGSPQLENEMLTN